MEMETRIQLTEKPIDASAELAFLTGSEGGAVDVFLGTTRRFTDGKETVSLSYEAADSLALAEMRRLLDDMRHVPNPWACVHGRPTALRLSLDSLDKHFGRHG